MDGGEGSCGVGSDSASCSASQYGQGQEGRGGPPHRSRHRNVHVKFVALLSDLPLKECQMKGREPNRQGKGGLTQRVAAD